MMMTRWIRWSALGALMTLTFATAAAQLETAAGG